MPHWVLVALLIAAAWAVLIKALCNASGRASREEERRRRLREAADRAAREQEWKP